MQINLELVDKAKQLVCDVFGRYNQKVNDKLENVNFEVANSRSTSHFDRENTVFIDSKCLDNLSVYVHELLHVISTSESFNKKYIGFHKQRHKKIKDGLYVESNFGYALNEGATHNYTVEALKDIMPNIKIESYYNVCANVYKNLERVLTCVSAKILYANANIDNFVKAVAKSCNTNEENVLKLILNLDAYYDTYRIFSVFLQNAQSADVKALFTNVYTYLAKIISDYKKSCGEKFNYFEDLTIEHLTKDDLRLFAEVGKNLDLKPIKSNPFVNQKLYENMAFQIMIKQEQKTLKDFEFLPKSLRCGEFFNYLLLATRYTDEKFISLDIKTQDEKAKITQKIYSPKFNALAVDKSLPQNIKTMLSARFAIRAGTATSDYYMEQAMQSDDFKKYLSSSDPDYYEAMCEMIKCKEENEQQMKLEK